jgi:hypothetical protein
VLPSDDTDKDDDFGVGLRFVTGAVWPVGFIEDVSVIDMPNKQSVAITATSGGEVGGFSTTTTAAGCTGIIFLIIIIIIEWGNGKDDGGDSGGGRGG